MLHAPLQRGLTLVLGGLDAEVAMEGFGRAGIGRQLHWASHWD